MREFCQRTGVVFELLFPNSVYLVNIVTNIVVNVHYHKIDTI